MVFHYARGAEFSFARALTKEWLETNRLGSYASSTSASNCNNRKYHGLLVSRLPALPSRYLLLNSLDDLLILAGVTYALTAHSYPNFLQDGSFPYLENFTLTTHPKWSFKFAEVMLSKEILLLAEENTVLVRYQFSGNCKDAKLVFCPLLAGRDVHELQRRNTVLITKSNKLPDGFSATPYRELPTLFFQTNSNSEFTSRPLWYYNFIYQVEAERGYPYVEDLFSPGIITVTDIEADHDIIFACSLERQRESLGEKWQEELKRRAQSSLVVPQAMLKQQLQRAAASFITYTATNSKASIVAGYHWFLEWGRDAMIALPGLTLCSGQEEVGVAILQTFARQEQHGLLPNIVGAIPADSSYNAVDSSLWFAWALQQYYLHTHKLTPLKKYFWQTLKNIFFHYQAGTKYHIKMAANGLLYAGAPNLNLTWMDAMVAGLPVIPRYGFLVEVNALWFNFLNFIYKLAQLWEDGALQQILKPLIPQVKKQFRATFWYGEGEYLYDYVNGEESSSELRPNQIFAVALPYTPLPSKLATKVVAAVTAHLLTPYGLRTLAPHAPVYRGTYGGGQQARDCAYHNGTVWPWLLAAFTEALLKTTTRSQTLATIVPCLEALKLHLSEYGIGSIAEIFSGDYPHSPNGCISQAWSVAELLRLIYLLDLEL